MRIIHSDFSSMGVCCRGLLYMPDDRIKPPVIIMAHGFGAQQDFRLPAYAERFTKVGIAAYTFDYRCFGISDGKPRNLVSPRRHLQDWQAAISHIRKLEAIDPERIALWGSSFSGGHVLVAASQDPNIAAVVSQVPFVDGLNTLGMYSFSFILSATLHGLWDIFKTTIFLSPHYVPIVASPGKFGMMNTPESFPGYMALIPEDSQWQNRCPARIGLTLPMYRPISKAGAIGCPALVIAAKNDSLVSFESVQKTAGRISKCMFRSLPIGHFDIYHGDNFEKTVDVQADFLKMYLDAT